MSTGEGIGAGDRVAQYAAWLTRLEELEEKERDDSESWEESWVRRRNEEVILS